MSRPLVPVMVVVDGGLMTALSFDFTPAPHMLERAEELVREAISQRPALLPADMVIYRKPDRYDMIVIFGRGTADPNLTAGIIADLAEALGFNEGFETREANGLTESMRTMIQAQQRKQ